MGLETEMDVSALRYTRAVGGTHVRSPLLRLQSDERLVTLTRRGNQAAFEVLVGRYQTRLLSFCRHMLGSREDAEDVLQDVLTASYSAMLADDRAIAVRPWLYRIARNRCLNHLRRARAVGVDSMDVHFAEHGATTADKAHEREEFRELLEDIRDLPETQRTALVLREMEALSYEQIAVAMETTIPSVKSLLVRARVSLTEAAEARLLSCDQVREELVEEAEGLRAKRGAAVRRHVKHCERCQVFQRELRRTDRVLAALAPVGLLTLVRKLFFAHALTHSASSAGVAGATGVGGASAGLLTAGAGAAATKAAAGLAAAAILTVGTVAVSQGVRAHPSGPSSKVLVARALDNGLRGALGGGAAAGIAGAIPGLAALPPAATMQLSARQIGSFAGAVTGASATRLAAGPITTVRHRNARRQPSASHR